MTGALARLRARPAAALAAALLACIALACAFGPLLAQHRYDQTDFVLGASGPSRAHWLGTDALGRDLLVRALVGGRVSLACAALGTALAVAIGLAVGAAAGFSRGAADVVLMRATDAFAAFPSLVLVVLVAVFFGAPESPPHRAFARVLGPLFGSPADPAVGAAYRVLLVSACLGVSSWPTLARVTRSSVLAVRSAAHVDAATVLGLRPREVLLRHVLPNAAGPIVAAAALTVPDTMLGEAFLSFVGVGTSEPLASWGLLVSVGADAMLSTPWELGGPGALLVGSLLAVNVLGDEARAALAPRAP